VAGHGQDVRHTLQWKDLRGRTRIPFTLASNGKGGSILANRGGAERAKRGSEK